MFSRIRKRLTYANVAMTVALVFAMSGGAYAAKKYLITSTKQISPSVLSALKGKAGSAGPAGTAGAPGAGAPGAQGPAGPVGAPGAKGEAGVDGKDGKEGKSGKDGKEGSPWTAGGTLPAGKTETGVWSFGFMTAAAAPGGLPLRVPISFTIPLAEDLEGAGCATVEPGPPPHVAATCHVHYINKAGNEVIAPGEEVSSTACTGTAAKPTATVGNLCVYTAVIEVATSNSASVLKAGGGEATGASTAGAVITFLVGEEAQAWGTWAVTAEQE